MLDLGLKIKSIEIDIEGFSEIYNITGNCDIESLKKMKENALRIRALLSELETPALTKSPINDKVVFKNLLINIVNDDRFIIKKREDKIYLLSKYVNELLRCKNIDRKKFYEFLRKEEVITTKKNQLACRVGKEVYSSIEINVGVINELLGV